MSKYLWPLLLITGLVAGQAHPLYRFDFPLDQVGRRYGSETRVKKDGSLLALASTELTRARYQGADFLVVTSTSEGTIQDKPFTSRLVRYYRLEDGRLTSDSLQGSTTSAGRPWTEYTINFDWTDLFARVRYQNFQKKETIDKSVPITTATVPIQDLDLYLSSLPARGIKEEKLKALLPNGQTFGFLLKLVDQPETVTVRGKEQRSVRIELKPDLGLISVFVPNVNYWLNAEPPHQLVRYSGLISGPGSPDVIQEIWEVK